MFQFQHIHAVCISLAAFLPLSQLVAQETQERLGPTLSGISDLTASGARAEGLWVSGDRYEAWYRDGSMEFVPALGEVADRLLPWKLSLLGIERGNTRLDAGDLPGRPRLAREGRQVRLFRGPGVEEVHHIGGHGLEVTYEFERAPGGEGDLVVRSRVSSELVAPTGRFGGEGLTFQLEGIGGVHLSGVVGIDAAGQRTPGAMEWDGGELVFRLPGNFVDGAEYPIVLDPVISPITQLAPGSTLDDSYLDVAYLRNINRYGVCWQRAFSQSDIRIRATLFSGSTNQSVGGVFLPVPSGISGNGRRTRPAIGSNRQENLFLIAWSEAAGPFAAREIMAASMSGNGIITGPTTLVSGANDHSNVDVASDARLGDTDCLVVYQEETVGVFCMQVATGASTFPAPGTPQLLSSDNRAGEAAIGKTMLTDRNLVVWRTGVGRIIGRFVDSSGVAVGPAALIADLTSANRGQTNPDVDGDGSVWLVAWEAAEPSASFPYTARNILCRHVRSGAAGNLVFSGPAVSPLGANGAGEDERAPSVACHDVRFVLTYEDVGDNNTGPWSVSASFIGKDLCQDCQVRETISSLSLGLRNLEPASCSKLSGGMPDTDEGLITWTQAQVGYPFTPKGLLRAVRSAGSGNTVANTGGGCGSAGAASVSGGSVGVLGNLNTRIWLTGASPSANVAFLWGAVANGPRFTCGPCQVLDPSGLAINIAVPVVGGLASVPVPIPCRIGLSALTVEFQFVVFNTGSENCGLVPGLGVGTTDIQRVKLSF